MPHRQRQTPRLPPLWLMTDERVDEAHLLKAVRRLPRGAGLIFRHYATPPGKRRALFDRVRRLARSRGLVLLLAGNPETARRWRADGWHGAAVLRVAGGGTLHSAPVHDLRELRRAERARADVLFVSPLFATRSHPGANPLGPVRFAGLARVARVPVMALGGVGRQHAALVRRLGASGYGAIDSLS